MTFLKILCGCGTEKYNPFAYHLQHLQLPCLGTISRIESNMLGAGVCVSTVVSLYLTGVCLLLSRFYKIVNVA